MKKVQEEVAQRIADSGPNVYEAVVTSMVSKEINARAQAIEQAVGSLANMQKELAKVDKPDNKVYVDGAEVVSYSEARYNDIKKKKEAIERLETAISKALEDNNADAYEKLRKASGGDSKKD